MKVHIVALFPETLESALSTSILGRIVQNGLLEPVFYPLADYSVRPTRRVDDRLYGGGRGTLLQCEPIARVIDEIYALYSQVDRPEVWVMAPDTEVWSHASAEAAAHAQRDLILVCGHYEGIDARVIEYYDMRRICIGPYILTGGETAALVVLDSIARLIPGGIHSESASEESFSEELSGGIEYPHYTRPSEWRGQRVPEVLISGDHAKVGQWRRKYISQ